MKRVLILFVFFVPIVSFAQPTFEYITNDTMDFGVIPKGSDPYRSLQFRNAGNAPLIISNARGSCGCTVPTYEKDPIAPGDTSTLTVRYDTDRLGIFNKKITLTTNDPNNASPVVTIIGEVLTTTDVDEWSHDDFRIYPTISNSQITVELSESDQLNWDIRIITITGQLVFQQQGAGKKLLVDINELSLGTYIVQIEFQDGRKRIRRFVRA